jgi:hypothetical protein
MAGCFWWKRLKGEKSVTNPAPIKDEIRKLNWSTKIGIYR